MSERPFVLCVDLDEVVAAYVDGFRLVVAEHRGVDPSTIGPQTAWDFESSPTWGIGSRDEFLALHNTAVANGLFRDLPEKPGAADALWRLSDQGVHIRIVTHRLVTNWAHERVAADTVAWLQRHRDDGKPRIPYRDLCLLGDKADLAGDVLVDDSPRNIEAVQAARARGMRAPLPVVFDTEYNRHIKAVRAHNWDEVEQIISELRSWRAAYPFASDDDFHV